MLAARAGASRPPLPVTAGGDKVQMVLFDLDGTLYDDILYTTAFTCALASRIPTRWQDEFLRDAFTWSPINRRLRLGMIYDRETDTLLGHPLLEPGFACSWDGEERRPWRPVLASGHVGASGRFLAIGDAWTLITAAALRCGASVDDCVEAMREMRACVALPPPESYSGHSFFRPGVPPVRVLVTNGSRPHAEDMLRHLGLDRAFAHRFTEAGKPASWREIIPYLERQTGIPRSAMVAVGDNLLNDVLPVVEIGARAVIVDRYGLFARYACSAWAHCGSLDEALLVLWGGRLRGR